MNKVEQILNLVKTTELNVTSIAKEIGLTKEDVIKILIEHEYYRLVDNPRARFFSIKKLHDAAIDYVNNFNGKVSINDYIKERGVEPQVFRDYIKKWYPNNQAIRYNHYDATIFDTIDTEEKAYWLGFIFADGYVTNPETHPTHRYSFELTLSGKDEDHIRKFAKFVNFTGKIEHRNITSCPTGNKESYPTVRITLNGQHLWEKLNSYGCTPKKSLTLKFPSEEIFQDKKLIRHFIRGYWDGDGTLGIYNGFVTENGVKYTYHNNAKCSVLGTYELLDKLNTYIPYKKTITLHSSDKYPCKAYTIQFSHRECFGMCYYMYYNSSIHLDRKYIKFLEICRLYEELYKKLMGKIGENCDVNPELIKSITKGDLIV